MSDAAELVENDGLAHLKAGAVRQAGEPKHQMWFGNQAATRPGGLG